VVVVVILGILGALYFFKKKKQSSVVTGDANLINQQAKEVNKEMEIILDIEHYPTPFEDSEKSAHVIDVEMQQSISKDLAIIETYDQIDNIQNTIGDNTMEKFIT
jgi:hypothetical protein